MVVGAEETSVVGVLREGALITIVVHQSGKPVNTSATGTTVFSSLDVRKFVESLGHVF
jgi:predicted SnoaL-like aldol condensation-catalyzing enzyme